MSIYTLIIAIVVAIVFLIALYIVRVKEGHDEDDQLFKESQRKLKSEYYRSMRLNK